MTGLARLDRTRLDLQHLAVPLIVVLALAASVSSLGNGYAYDDSWIISTNTRVHSLHHWWNFFGQSYWPPSYQQALYRPLTILAFAIEWAIGGGKPWPFHAANVVLYVACCLLLYRFACLLLPPFASWVVAALFAVHPVHVEAVGNSVGQSELWVAAILLAAMSRYVTWRREGPLGWPRIGALALFYLASILFKENGIVLVGLLAALELTVVEDARPWRARLAGFRPLALLFVLVALLTIVARFQVLHAWTGDNPHPAWVELTGGQRLLTVVGVLVPEWARLLVWPARLVADYSPLDIPLHRTASLATVPGVVMIVGLFTVLVVSWKRAPVAACGLLIMFATIAPVSNVLFASGVMIAERTLFLPSAGLLLAVGAAVPWLLAQLRRGSRPVALAAAGTLAVVLVAGTVRSATRQLTWKSSTDVFLELMADAPLNFRAHYGWGGELIARKLFAQGEKEWRLAVRLYPFYHGVKFDLAEGYARNKMCGAAVPLYREVLRTAPDRADARAKLTWCLLEVGSHEAARDEAVQGIEWGNSIEAFRILLARAYRGMREKSGGPTVAALADLRHAAARARAAEDAQPFTRSVVPDGDGAGR